MRILLLSAIIGLVVGLCGCGGGTKQVASTTGSMKLSVIWPSLPETGDERYVPRAANSLVVSIDNGAGYTKTQTLSRSPDKVSCTVTFEEVPVGDIAILVVAMPEADGTGTPLAQAETVAQIVNRQTATVYIDLNSTITEVVIDAAPTPMHTTESSQLLASARNATGALVPVLPSPQGFRWSSSDPAVAEVDQTGKVLAIGAGRVRIAAMERETGVSGTAELVVKAANGRLDLVIICGDVAVAIQPATAEIMTEGLARFSAQVEGMPNQAVLWSVQEEDGGSISAAGEYFAPAVPGTYHVTATSIADESKMATATVIVRQARIVFMNNGGDNNYDIYTIKPDGSDLVRLTTHATLDAYPSLSSDGTRITFSSKNDGKFSIFTMNVDGTNRVRLTDPTTYNFQSCWSPDGRMIACYSDRLFNHDIYLMDADGGNQRALMTTPGYECYPCFSADGMSLFYTSDETGNPDLFRRNLDGSGAVNLTNNAGIYSVFACSPDGRTIVFESHRNGSSDLYLMDIDGGNVRQLTDDAYTDTEPSFSPDGRRIVFSSTRTTDGNDELFIMDIDGSNIRQLTDMPEGICLSPSWWL